MKTQGMMYGAQTEQEMEDFFGALENVFNGACVLGECRSLLASGYESAAKFLAESRGGVAEKAWAAALEVGPLKPRQIEIPRTGGWSHKPSI